MKYINQLNLILVAIGIIVVIYTFSQTFWSPSADPEQTITVEKTAPVRPQFPRQNTPAAAERNQLLNTGVESGGGGVAFPPDRQEETSAPIGLGGAASSPRQAPSTNTITAGSARRSDQNSSTESSPEGDSQSGALSGESEPAADQPQLNRQEGQILGAEGPPAAPEADSQKRQPEEPPPPPRRGSRQ
ncbi:MAG: hypothetical protein ACRD1R_12835 [Acidobacteriota bacterium]